MDVRVNGIVKAEIRGARQVVHRDDHCMVSIAKIIGTISGNVVLIWRSILVRLRAEVAVYEDAIESEIASCIRHRASYVWENEKYPDGNACKVEQCCGKDREQRGIERKFLTCKRECNV